MPPSHVAIITSNFWPERTGNSQTVTEFARFLDAAGADVRVATSMPYYPEWRIRPAYRRLLWLTERVRGMTVHRSWHFVRPRPTTFTRVIQEFTLCLFGLPSIIRALRGARTAYVVTPALTFAFIGLVIARLFRIRRVLVVKDVMPDAAVELGMLRNRTMIRLSRYLARRAYEWADEIQTLGEGMRSRIARETRVPEKIRIVPDTIDGQELEPVPYAQNEFRRKYVPPGVFAVLHTGNMGVKQDLDLLLRTARRLLGDPEVGFYVFGDGAVKEKFLATRAEWGLDNIAHHPLQDRYMLRHMLSGADVVVVSQLPEVVDIVVPSKLITALGAGAMVIAACAGDSETAKLMMESGGGIVIPASDDLALANAIGQVKRGDVDSLTCRRRAREFAMKRFERRTVYGPLVGDLLGNDVRDERGLAARGSELQSQAATAKGLD